MPEWRRTSRAALVHRGGHFVPGRGGAGFPRLAVTLTKLKLQSPSLAGCLPVTWERPQPHALGITCYGRVGQSKLFLLPLPLRLPVTLPLP